MRALVAIPWRPNGDLLRARNLNFVKKWFEAEDFEVVTVDSPGETFNRSAVRNACAKLALDEGADVVVINDADCIPPLDSLCEAIPAALDDGRLHYPFLGCRYLDYTTSECWTHYGHEPENDQPNTAYPADRPGASGGSFVIRPDMWFAAGGMDERLATWGGEDDAFYASSGTLLGLPVYHHGVMFHLHHGRDEIAFGTEEHEANLRLLRRYADAQGDREAMRALVNEWR